MAFTKFEEVAITGLVCAVPTHDADVRDLAKESGKEDVDRFIETTGVRCHPVANENQTCADLCYEAADVLLRKKGYDANSIGGIILITQHPDYTTPATAHVLHKRLGLNDDCFAFDVNLGCSGFVYGLSIACSMIQARLVDRVLLCCGEACIPGLDTLDPSDNMLFGDAGSAVMVERGDDSIEVDLHADGEGYTALIKPGWTSRIKINPDNVDVNRIMSTMDGSAVFEFAIIQVPRMIKKFFKRTGHSMEDFDYCVFHQANLMMLKHIGKKLKLEPEKMPISMDRYGNTSSVSIPLTIADMVEREKCPDTIRIISCGFGIGLSWGLATFQLSASDVHSIVRTDGYFEDAYMGNSQAFVAEKVL